MSEADPSTTLHSYVELVHTMGTVVSIDVRAPERPPGLDTAVTAVARRLRDIDEALSTWRTDSWVSRLAEGLADIRECPPDVRHVISLAHRLEELTDGYFSPWWRRSGNGTAGPDPTGLVKGWAAQQSSDVLLAHGLRDHVVNAAGDLVLSGTPGGPLWRVGISDPFRSPSLMESVELAAGPMRWAVATSGVAEQGMHVVDPHTGAFSHGVVSATAVVALHEPSDGGAVADAAATALVAAGDRAGVLVGRLGPCGVRALVVDETGAVADYQRLLTAGPRTSKQVPRSFGNP